MKRLRDEGDIPKKDPFVIIEGCVFRMEIWKYYHDIVESGVLQHYKQERDMINCFQIFLKYDVQANVYQDLTIRNVWDLLEKLNEVFTGMNINIGVSESFSVEEIETELDAFARTVHYWALTEGHETHLDLDPKYLNDTLDGSNLKFQYRVYYLLQVLYGVLEKTKSLSFRSLEDIREIRDIDLNFNVEETHEYIKDQIRKAYGGDLDEFIGGVTGYIQEQSLTVNHMHLSIRDGYEIGQVKYDDSRGCWVENGNEQGDNNKLWGNMVKRQTIWRFLYNNYFDEHEDVFPEFFKQYMPQCILYFGGDYLNGETFGVKHVPIYNVFTTNHLKESYSKEISFLISKEMVKNSIEKIYNK